MQDADPKYISVEEFNEGVRSWTISTRRSIRGNLSSKVKGESKEWKGRKTQKLSQSLTYALRKRLGETFGIRFNFERHGVFLHYGVGRGYVKTGTGVSRGSRFSDDQIGQQMKRGYTRREAMKMKNVHSGSIDRKPVDWFNSEIDKNMSSLADIAVEYHGDEVLKQIVEVNEKARING